MGAILSTECWIEDQRCYGKYYIENVDYTPEADNAITALASLLKELDLDNKKIGIEQNYIDYNTFTRLQHSLPDVNFINSHDFVKDLRIIKTAEEINRIRDIVKITKKAYLKAFEFAGEGVSELDSAKALKLSLVKDGADWIWIEMGAGERGGNVNAQPIDYKMKKSEVFRLDLGAMKNGYCADLSRNAVIGPPNDKQEKIHKALLSGYQGIMDEIGPGVSVSHLFKLGMDTVKESFPKYWRYHLGHGVGLSAHEAPHVRSDVKDVLKTGMVLTIELPYYLGKDGGYNIEDVILITKDGYESISTMDRSIHIL
jgi:Xaa-Pro aminopeptidase